MADRQITIVAEFPAHFPAVSADQDALIDALACLLARAGQLTSHNEVKVRAELLAAGERPKTLDIIAGDPGALAAGGPWAIVRVSLADDGKGADDLLADAQRPSAERPWFKPTCPDLLDEFSENYWLESDRRTETRMVLALPLWAAYAVGTDITSLHEAVASRLPDRGGEPGTLLLMVEDPDLRTVLVSDLEAAGYQVVAAESGEAVLSLAREVQPDVVLLDLLSRAPTAFEVAGILKYDRRTRNTPVLFLTSADDPKGGVSMGAVSYLVRHADTGSLVMAINAILTSGLEPLGRVLVVEQDDRLRERMVMMIQSQGYRVSEARSGVEALALAERVPPAIAMVNAQLAQERDYWLLRGLRQVSSGARIYVLADVLSEEEGRQVLRRGASGYSETGKLPDLLNRVRQDKPPTSE